MARTDNLNHFFTFIADAIRSTHDFNDTYKTAVDTNSSDIANLKLNKADKTEIIQIHISLVDLKRKKKEDNIAKKWKYLCVRTFIEYLI